MKTLIFFIVFELFSFVSNAQIQGVDFSTATNVNSLKDGDQFNEVLIYTPSNGGMYTYTFDKTPVGLKHCVEDLTVILLKNDKRIAEPDVKNELFADYVQDGIFSYSDLNASSKVGESEVKNSWYINGYVVMLYITTTWNAIVIKVND